MESRITSGHDAIILDACCVINLYASRQMAGIVACIAETVAVAVYVLRVEALAVYQTSAAFPEEREAIDLRPLIDDGLLLTADLASAAEKAAMVHFISQRLDDGEAATAAIAVNRNWAVATDDRAARRRLTHDHGDIQLISTPQLLRHWVERAQPTADVVRRALRDVESRANYLVGQRHPLYAWWQAQKGE